MQNRLAHWTLPSILVTTLFSATMITAQPQFTINEVPGTTTSTNTQVLFSPQGVAVDWSGNAYFVSSLTSSTGSHTLPYVNKASTSGALSVVAGVAVDNLSNFYFTQGGGGAIFRVTGGITYQVTQTTQSQNAVAVDNTGNLYYAAHYKPVVYKTKAVASAPSDGVPVAGNGTMGCTGGSIGTPLSVAVDYTGNIYIADPWCQVIWKAKPSGALSVFAGTPGSAGFGGDTGLATGAFLYGPEGVAVDLSGNVYIADSGNGRIRMVNTAGYIYTIAGGGTNGLGDGGPATSAQLMRPYGIAVGPGGTVVF